MSLFKEEQEREADERGRIDDLREQILEVVGKFDLGEEF